MIFELLQTAQQLQTLLSNHNEFQTQKLPIFTSLLDSLHQSFNFEGDDSRPLRSGMSAVYDQLVSTLTILESNSHNLRSEFCDNFGFSVDGKTPEFKLPFQEGNDRSHAIIEVTPAQYRNMEKHGHDCLKLGGTQTRIRLLYKV